MLDKTCLKRGSRVQLCLINEDTLFDVTVQLVCDFGLAAVDMAGTPCFFPWASILSVYGGAAARDPFKPAA